jgi:cytochrome c biogenesis protein
MTSDKSQTPNPKSQIAKRAWRFAGRVDVAAVLIVIVLLIAALGSCFPQLSSSVAADPERLARWEAVVCTKYGALTDLLAASGAFRCFRSPVFLIPLALLAVATLVCTFERWRGVWRRAFHQPVRCPDVALDAAPHAARLTAPPTVDLAHVVREGLERRGFRTRAAEAVTTNQPTNQPAIYLRGDRNRLAPLATLVTHLAVLLLLLGAVLSSVYGWREEVTIGPGETARVGHGSGLALRNEEFVITRYPDGSVAGYEARVAVVMGGREAARGSIRVNEPLTYGPVGFHLRGYGGTEDRYSIALLAVHDPGYGPVVVAGFLLLFGMAVSFNFPHCWIHARVEPGGTLRLAGRADRRACDFGREFASLVEEFKRAVEGEGEGGV